MGLFSSLSSILEFDFTSKEEVTQARNDLEAMHKDGNIRDDQYESINALLEDKEEDLKEEEED